MRLSVCSFPHRLQSLGLDFQLGVSMSGHDIAHNPTLLAIYIAVCVIAVIAGSLYGRYLRRTGRKPPWR